MDNKKMVIDTQLEMFQYLQIVSDIALEYYDSDGKYQPHIGLINAMRIFYNVCVKESKFDDLYGHDISYATEIQNIASDKEFIQCFNEAIKTTNVIDFTFGNAYQQALDIVEYKKTSFENIIDIFSKAIFNIVSQINQTISEKDVDKLIDTVDKFSQNKIGAKEIVEAYTQIKSQSETT